MIIREGEHLVELRVVEESPPNVPGAGDLRLYVRASFQGFSGEYDEVWVEGAAFRSFVGVLHVLNSRGRGAAVLHSMSPGELDLEVRSVDRTGVEKAEHIVAEGQLGRTCFGFTDDPRWCQVAFAIRCRSSMLLEMLEEFQPFAEHG